MALHLYFDYVDPASYLLELRVRGFWEPGTLSLSLHPFEVAPPPAELLDLDRGPWARHWEAMEDAAMGMEVPLTRPWIVPWSRKAHEMATMAREEGCFPEIHRALFRAYLLDGLDIGRVDVLVELARKNGMDPTATKVALDVDQYRAAVEWGREGALAVGVRRAPTILREDRRIEGYPDEKSLEELLGQSPDP